MSERIQRTPEDIQRLATKSVEIAGKALVDGMGLGELLHNEQIVGTSILSREIFRTMIQEEVVLPDDATTSSKS